MIKIRFYHWWVYHLYRYFWNPILMQRPDMVNEMANRMIDWLEMQRENKQ